MHHKLLCGGCVLVLAITCILFLVASWGDSSPAVWRSHDARVEAAIGQGSTSKIDVPGRSAVPVDRHVPRRLRHGYEVELLGTSAWGLPSQSGRAAFGVADSCVAHYEGLLETGGNGGVIVRWSADSPNLALVVDAGHLRRVEVAAGLRSSLWADQVLEAMNVSEAVAPPRSTQTVFPWAQSDSHATSLFEVAEDDFATCVASEWSARGRVHGGFTVSGHVTGCDGMGPGSFVVELRGNGINLTARTESSGRYVIDGVPPGEWDILAGDKAYNTATGKVRVETSEVAHDLQLRAVPSVRGVVVDRNGAPVVGARILWWTDGGGWRNGAMTRSDGTFVAHGIDGIGEGHLWACVPGEGLQWPLVGTRMQPDSFIDLVAESEGASGSLVVRVLDHVGIDPQAMSVRLWQVSSGLGLRAVRLEDNSSFLSENMPSGFYDIEISCPGLGILRVGRRWVARAGRVDVGVHLRDYVWGSVRVLGPESAWNDVNIVRVAASGLVTVRPVALRSGERVLSPSRYVAYRNSDGKQLEFVFDVLAGSRTLLDL